MVCLEKYTLTWRQRGALWLRIGIRLACVLAVVWSWNWIGRRILGVTLPFLLAWVLAAVLDVPVQWCQRRLKMPREAAALALILLLITLIGGGVFLLVYYAGRELMEFARDWEVLFSGFQSARESLTNMFARLFSIVPPELTETVDAAIDGVLIWMEQTIPAALKGLGERTAVKFKSLPAFAVALLMFVMGSYFITADYPSLCRRMAGKVSRRQRETLLQLKTTVFSAFGGYLRAQLVLSFGVFCILLLGFLLTGQSYSLLLALSLAVVDFIPLLGAGIVMIPWAGFALLTHAYVQAIAIIAIWGVISVYRRVAEPKVVGEQTGLSPILSLFSIYVGMKLFGVTGMIFAPVLVLVIRNLIRAGAFERTAADFSIAIGDLVSILKQN